MTPVTFVVVDDSLPSAVELEGVLVRIYSEDGSTFVTEASTDVDGRLTLDLEDLTTYWVRFFKVGYAFNSKATIAVDGALLNSFDVVGRNLTTLVPSTDPNLCRASGYLVNGTGVPTQHVTMYFMLTGKPRVVGGRAMLPSKVYATTDASGFFEVELVRNGVYDTWAAGSDDTIYRVVVPDYPNIDITDLIFPEMAVLELNQSSLTVSAGSSTEVPLTAQLSSRVFVPYTLENGDIVSLASLLLVKPVSGSGASAGFTRSGLKITGLTSGSSITFEVSVKPDVFVARQPTSTAITASIVVTVL
jgi:hypothetical protein